MPRRLGQHFLKDKKALRKIAAALEIDSRDTIVEIGPGHGELTGFLVSASPKEIITIEKDKKLANVLRQKLQITKNKSQTNSKSQIPNIKIIEGDALKKLQLITSKLKTYKLVGNIPYYITGHLLRKISELGEKPKLIVLTVQREVAERIVARPPRMNLLAASVQFWGEPKIVGYISKKSFRPPPKVDSAILKIVPRKVPPFTSIAINGGTLSEERYYQFIKILFKQPRKTILNNLREGLKLSSKEIEKQLKKLNLSPQSRPADLSLNDINKLAQTFSKKGV